MNKQELKLMESAIYAATSTDQVRELLQDKRVKELKAIAKELNIYVGNRNKDQIIEQIADIKICLSNIFADVDVRG